MQKRLPNMPAAQGLAVIALCTLLSSASLGADPVAKIAKASSAKSGKSHPLETPLELVRSSLKSISAVQDYQATFIKKEIVRGVMYPHHTLLKFRPKPHSVYMFYLKLHQGREVIYVEGRNDNMIVAHETGIAGLIGAIKIAPTSATAMAEGTNPITRIGMAKMAEGVIDQWERELPYDDIDVKYYPNAKLGDRPCQVIQSTYLAPRKQFKYHMTRLYLDKETNFPVRVEQYGFPSSQNQKPPLAGEWTYKDIKVNVGFQNIDFDPANPKYNY